MPNNESGMETRLARRYLGAAVGMFVLGWASTSLHQMWTRRNISWDACATSMRIVYVATKHIPPEVKKREAVEAVKRVLFDGFRPTKDEDTYMSGRESAHGPWRITQSQWALLCAEDPKFPIKVLMSRTTTLDFEPSYRLSPDRDTVVYCPFHHQALLDNGGLERR